MSQNSVSEVILKFSLDEQAQRRVLKGVGDVEAVLSKTSKRLVSVEDAAAGLNAEFAELARAKAIENLSADAIRAASETDDWANELERVSTLLSAIGASEGEIKQVARALASAQEQSTTINARTVSTSGSRGSGGVDTVDRIGSIGSQLFSGLGQGELANAAGLVGDIAGATGALGPLGIALAVITPAIGLVTSEISKNTEKERERAEALRTVAEAIVSGTRAEVEAKINALQVDNTINEQQIRLIEERTGKTREFFESLTTTDAGDFGLVGQLANLSANLQGLGGDAGVVAGANKSIEDNVFLIDALRAVLDENATAATDAVAAESALGDQRQRNIDERLAREAAAAQREVQIVEQRIRIDGMTEEARETRIAAVRREIEILTSVRDSTTVSWQAAEELSKKIYALNSEMMLLSETAATTADASKAAADALKAQEEAQKLLSLQTDNYFRATEQTTRAQEALFKAQEDAAKVYDKYMTDTLEISRKAEEQYQQIVADSGDKRTDIVQKTEDQIAKIQRDAGRELFNAVAERDALAAYLAAQQATDELADEKKAQADQLKEQEKAQAKQLDSLRKSVDQQVRTRDMQYRNEQSVTAQAALRAQIDLMNSKNVENAIAANGANGMRSIISNMWGQLTIEAVNGVNAILTSTRQLVGGFGGTQMYVNGVNPNSPAAYDLVGLPPPQTTAVNRAVDTRLNTYFRTAGITRD